MNKDIENLKNILVDLEDAENGAIINLSQEEINSVAELERELAKERKKSKDLQARLDWLHSLNDCDEEFEL